VPAVVGTLPVTIGTEVLEPSKNCTITLPLVGSGAPEKSVQKNEAPTWRTLWLLKSMNNGWLNWKLPIPGTVPP